jgi:hypothetical protein
MTSTQRLIIFTRYPEPGKAKTRLIPALGEAGAAALHQQMAEHTIRQAQTLQLQQSAGRKLGVEVRFAGGDRDLMQQWLGANWMYTGQGEGDLGDRMARSFQSAFSSGVQQVIIIGTDCPDLNAPLLATAFHTLHQQDLVLGPASDGGYYLIGLRRLIPQLLTGIAWSTATVLEQTLAIAEELNLAIALLPILSDVDYPADLKIWDRIRLSG